MSKISKHKLLPEIENHIWNSLLETLHHTNTIEKVNTVLCDILTPSEKIIFSKRLAIATFLNKGYSYAQISYLLKVSSATINHVQNSLKRAHSGYIFLNTLNQDKTINSLFEKINQYLSTMPPKSGRNRWKFVK